MQVQRPWPGGAELAGPLFGAGLTLLLAYLAVHVGAEISLGIVGVIGLFVVATIAFVAYPHLAVAGTIVLFALVPLLTALVWADLGGIKDIVVLAAATAGLLMFLSERRRPDGWVLAPVLLLLGLYVINVGGTHDVAWLDGLRLMAEPLVLLLVGLMLPEPRRTLRFALGALIATACVVAAYGIVQQVVGRWELVGWGYTLDDQVRVIPGGPFRSFGTLDDPFAYAALLLFGIVGVLFWMRRGPLAWGAAALLLVGLGVSFVRTAALILVALGGLAMARLGYGLSAVLLAAAAILASALILAGVSREGEAGTLADADTASAVDVVLEERASAWSRALGDNRADWILGRGVGEAGIADSGYFATVADVGFVGLAVLLAILGRLLLLSVRAARRRAIAGWVALGMLATLLLDAVTRDSFTGFPTAFISLLVVGVALAAVREDAELPTPQAPRPD